MNRLGFNARETEWLSIGEFIDLYREYQNVFDLENMLRVSKKTYHDLREKIKYDEKPIEF